MKYLKTFEAKIRHNFTDKMVTDIKGIFVELGDIGLRNAVTDIKGGICVHIGSGGLFDIETIKDPILMLIDYMKIESNENILVSYEFMLNHNSNKFIYDDLSKIEGWVGNRIWAFKIKIIF